MLNEYSEYEKALIEDGINPSICYMTHNSNWPYLWEMKTMYAANISMVNGNPKCGIKSLCYKDYDIIIHESSKIFDDANLHRLSALCNIISSTYHKKVILVYSSLVPGFGHNIRFYLSDQGIMSPNFDTLDGQFSTKDILSLASQYFKRFQPDIDENVKTIKF